jgi:serine/threonine-protein kinase
VVATGAQPRITPTPPTERIKDTMMPGQASPPPVPAVLAPAGDHYVGSTIADRYRVISKLGEGGMGVVYLAEHVFIEKRVALKVLSEDFARKADLVARFMQEAKAASKIGHENIVDITDFGETASGSVFFAMEYLEGKDLAAHIRDGGAMPFARARFIMNQICRALGAAHGKGIIHRDMKPENVYLVTREGKPDFVKVLDFGIAKMSSLDEGGSRLTRTGMIFGTPEYMSPEQARGDRPDHRVDIYAAGCILYEMLTGDVPFHAETFMGVLTKHMFEAPVPPSQRMPGLSIPPAVEAAVMRALEKDRDKRFQTMKELALALEEADGGGDLTGAWGGEPSHAAQPRSSTAAHAAQGRPSQAVTAIASSPSTANDTIQVPKKRNGLAIGGAVLALALVAMAAAVALKPSAKPAAPPVTPPAAPPTVAQPAPSPPPVKPVEAAKPAEPAKPTRHTMSINTQPSGAEVFRGPERLCVATPCSFELAASQTAVELTLRKKGYKDQPLHVVADRDHDFVADLLAEQQRHHPAAAKPAAKPAAAPPVVAAPPKPAEPPPAPKPAGKLRDLKDPFAN